MDNPGISHTRRLALVSLCVSSLLLTITAGDSQAQVAANELHGDCLVCHLTDSQSDGALILPEPDLCQQCHSPHNDHPVLVPARVDATLPLANGLMTCITCHDQHSPQPLQLRLPASQLCVACHDR